METIEEIKNPAIISKDSFESNLADEITHITNYYMRKTKVELVSEILNLKTDIKNKEEMIANTIYSSERYKNNIVSLELENKELSYHNICNTNEIDKINTKNIFKNVLIGILLFVIIIMIIVLNKA
jgi:hypothetical protein